VKNTQRKIKSWKAINSQKALAVAGLAATIHDDQNQQSKNNVGYITAFAAQCGLPHSDPTKWEWHIDSATGVVVPGPLGPDEPYVRQNGALTLRVTSLSGAIEDGHIPYGAVPRQLMGWVSTDVMLRQHEPEYWKLEVGDNLTEFMEKRLSVKPTGGPRGSITAFRNQSWNLFTSAISVVYNSTDQTGDKRSFRGLALAEEVEFWENFKHRTSRTLWGSHVVLNRRFADAILMSCVPYDWRIMTGVRDSALGIDLYWCFLRRWWEIYAIRKGKSQFLPWTDIMKWCGAQYSPTSQGIQSFERAATKQIKIITALQRNARLNIERGIHGGVRLLNSPKALVSPTKAPRFIEAGISASQ
jgi:hypothetical protein